MSRYAEFEAFSAELEEHRALACLECGEQWDGCYCADDAEPLDLNDSNDFEAKP